MKTIMTVLLSVGCVLGPSATAATPPCECPGERAPTLPPTGATGVPTNVRIFVSHPPRVQPSMVRLVQVTGEGAGIVPARVELSEVIGSFWLVPEAPLAPDTEHAVRTTENELFASWTTGSGPDEQPPLVADAAFTPAPAHEVCDDHRAARFGAAIEDATPPEELLFEVVTSTGKTIYVSGRDPLLIDYSGETDAVCERGNFDRAPEGPVTAVVRVMDLAGNTAEVPGLSIVLGRGEGVEEPPTGCSAGARAPGPAGGVLLLLAGLAARVLRRRAVA